MVLTAKLWRFSVVWLPLLLALTLPTSAWAFSDEEVMSRLRSMVAVLDRTETAVRAGDQSGARSTYQGYRDGWAEIEDDIRPRARDLYRSIESEMRNVNASLRGQPLNTQEALADVARLRAETTDLIERLPSTPAASSSGGTSAGMTALLSELDAAAVALADGRAADAAARIDQAQELWPDVEGAVKVKSPSTYSDVENNLALASASLKGSADLSTAASAIDQLQADLRPYGQGGLTYNAFDAGITVLREGMEALLVVTGLLAYVKRTASTTAQRWVWGGASLGILASIGIALVLQVAFSQVPTGTSRELLEGITGVFAAVMLVYMSYWLHSKANLNAWNRYVDERTTAALARNSMFSLALIAFLAIFREGGETALFLLGMMPSIALSELALGLGVGTGLLLAFGVALVGFGMRIPIRPFFLGTSVLIYYLALKFVGSSVHALQVAVVAPATPSPFPPVEIVGLYPTWETTIPQLALLAITALALAFAYLLPRDRPANVGPA